MLYALNQCTSPAMVPQKKKLTKYFLVLVVAYGIQFIYFVVQASTEDLICQITMRIFTLVLNRFILDAFAIIPMILLHRSSFEKKQNPYQRGELLESNESIGQGNGTSD